MAQGWLGDRRVPEMHPAESSLARVRDRGQGPEAEVQDSKPWVRRPS